MDGELWTELYHCIELVAQTHSQKPMGFSDAVIVTTYAWSVVHDRPTCWACDRDNWPPDRQGPLPSQPTMSRRLKHDEGVRRFLRELEAWMDGCLCLRGLILCRLLDGKPLPIGRHSHDPDADFGRGSRGIDKGYKAHLLWHASPLPIWEVRPMNVAEPTMALRLISRAAGEGYVLADKSYDSNPLHRRASAKGLQLVAPPKKDKGAGRGHHRQSPARLHALEMLRRPMGRDLMRLRVRVEQRLGNLCSFGGGLAPLPSWVRRLDRVRRWVQMKLVINALRIRRVLERDAA